jgi:hypothetical protein
MPKPINEEHTLLGYLDWLGMDNGADYDDGANGWFSWRVEERQVDEPVEAAGVLTVDWQYPDLIGPVRELLVATGLPYVIENVPNAPLKDPVTLCGSMFDLYTTWQDTLYGLRRHRGFETSLYVPPPPCSHRKGVLSIGVYGNGAGGGRPRSVKGPGFEQARREVMDIDWMTREELNESIPPAYTDYVGTHLRYSLLDSTSNEAA